MKKITMLFAMILVQACSSSSEVAPVEEAVTAFESKVPELDFYGLPNKSATNIQVFDYVKINLEITKMTGVNLVVVKPEGKSATYHDILNTDYELYIASATESGKYLKVESLNLVKGANAFYIKPLVPGTFQIKLKDPTLTFKFDDPIAFNAVKISTSTTGGRDGNCGLNKWYHKDYWFTIDDGNQTFDNYMTDSNASFGYQTSYDNQSLSGNFELNKDLKIINTQSNCGSYPGVPDTISSITITKTINNVSQVVATYYNLPINPN